MIMENEYPQIFSEAIPKSETLVFEPLLVAYKKLLYLENTVFFGVLMLLGILGYMLTNKIEAWIFYLFVGVWAFIFLFILLLIVLGFGYKGYAIGEKDIHYKTGYLVRRITTVPINRIQHIKIQQGVLAKIWNLAKLEIYTAGDSSGDLTIQGISFQKAQDIKALVTDKIKENERG